LDQYVSKQNVRANDETVSVVTIPTRGGALVTSVDEAIDSFDRNTGGHDSIALRLAF
jgi:hypothetical protein